MCQGRNIAFKISTFIPFSFIRSAKNEGLIPESFMKISSSSLDFHKNCMPNPAGENVTGALKQTGMGLVYVSIGLPWFNRSKAIHLFVMQSMIGWKRSNTGF